MFDGEKLLVYTNVFFLVPLFLAIVRQKIWLALLIGAVIFLSTGHHLFKKPGAEWWWNTAGRSPLQTILLLAEIIVSLILLIWAFFLLVQKILPWIFVASIIFFLSLILYWNTDSKKYVLYHSIWHFAAATVLSLALV